ncbi:MAG: type II secretion system F family protein [Eubacterium sp.]|nr:type II secretion system F family protein [Eubacterium sp.]
MAKNDIYTNSGISTLCSELGVIIKSGITVTDGLFMLAQEEEDKEKKRVLEKMLDTLEQGGSVYDAFSSAGAFPSYFLEMIAIGEKTGRIEAVLFSLSSYYARQDELSGAVRSAVIYPAALLITVFAVIVILVTYVLPVFSDVFAQLGLTMSDSSMWIMTTGAQISHIAVIVIAALTALLIIGVILYRIPGFKKLVLSAVARTKTAKALYSARFASALSMTLSSGMDIDESVEMSEKLIENPVMLAKIKQIRKDMSEGKPFVDAVAAAELFSGVYTRMISIGFNTGTIDNVMEEIAEKNESRVNSIMQTAVSRFEPAMIIIMAVIVGFILLSVMLPLLGIMTVIG